MVGQVDRKDEISKALKSYILKDREKQRLEDEAEAEKMRKKKEHDEKKLKEEIDYKATKDKLAELTKRHEQLQQNKIKAYEHLKKLMQDNTKHRLEGDDIMKLLNIGLAVPHISTAASHQPVHAPSCVSASVIPRTPTVSVSSQYKTITTTGLPVQAMQTQKRNRSPSPTIYRSAYPYKQSAGPHPFQKHEDPHRNHEYGRSYQYSKPGNGPPSGTYSAFYPPPQNVAYSHPSPPVHGNPTVYSSYNSNRENVEAMHKSHSPPVHPPPNQQSHPSMYVHRSSHPGPPSGSIQQSNHVYHGKGNQVYADEKYYMVRSGSHVPHGVIPIPQSQGVKHGSITSGYPVRPVATQMNPSGQIHIQSPHGSHHPSQSSHHSSQPHHASQPSHHPSMSSHHSQSHHPSSQAQSLLQASHPSHHPPSGVHYAPSHHPQSHSSSQSSQSSHSSQQPPSSVQSHHPGPHHLQQLHVQSHHPPPNSHHQLMSHHSSPSIHHSSPQQHMQSAIHHQSHHPSQQMHHQQIQSHIQQHISSHESRSQHPSVQQSQPTSVVTSQAYANQISAIQGGSRVVYSQPNLPH